MRTQITANRADLAMAQIRAAQACPDVQFNESTIAVLTGRSKSTIHRAIKAGEFPAPMSRGRWHAGTVLAHLAATKATQQPA